MVIANPIYDVVFKRLMEDKLSAKFFIETLLEEPVEDIQVKPQEYTFFSDPNDTESPEAITAAEKRVVERFTISVFRLDFIATIKTKTGGYKKVLIEIQKAKDIVDVIRFRNYLAEQYKREDEVSIGNRNKKEALPIVTIFVLGFQLPDIETPALKISRQYIDLKTHHVIEKKSDFIEKLTHDSLIVQVNRISGKPETNLDKLLSLFEQDNFLDYKEHTKDYKYPVDDEIVKRMIEILHHMGTDPVSRKKIENEQEAHRVFDLYTYDLKEALVETEKALEETEKALEEKDKALEEQNKALEEQKRLIEELKRQLSKK